MHFVQQKLDLKYLHKACKSLHLTGKRSNLGFSSDLKQGDVRCLTWMLPKLERSWEIRISDLRIKRGPVVIILVSLSEVSQKKTLVLRSASLHSFLCSSSSSSSSWFNSFADLSFWQGFWRFLRQWRHCEIHEGEKISRLWKNPSLQSIFHFSPCFVCLSFILFTFWINIFKHLLPFFIFLALATMLKTLYFTNAPSYMLSIVSWLIGSSYWEKITLSPLSVCLYIFNNSCICSLNLLLGKVGKVRIYLASQSMADSNLSTTVLFWALPSAKKSCILCPPFCHPSLNGLSLLLN